MIRNPLVRNLYSPSLSPIATVNGKAFFFLYAVYANMSQNNGSHYLHIFSFCQ